jgi:Uma2 family endonuclease
MAVAQKVSVQEYEVFALAHPDGQWELHNGRLMEKPGVSWEHGGITTFLGHFLLLQLDWSQFTVRIIDIRTRMSEETIFIPDVAVVPIAYGRDWVNRPGTLAVLPEPLPLVVEVWSASTGRYDVDVKVPFYQRRGDLEIWRIHPYERTLTRWVRQADGTYRETVDRGGTIELVALPGITIDLDQLFVLASRA